MRSLSSSRASPSSAMARGTAISPQGSFPSSKPAIFKGLITLMKNQITEPNTYLASATSRRSSFDLRRRQMGFQFRPCRYLTLSDLEAEPASLHIPVVGSTSPFFPGGLMGSRGFLPRETSWMPIQAAAGFPAVFFVKVIIRFILAMRIVRFVRAVVRGHGFVPSEWGQATIALPRPCG